MSERLNHYLLLLRRQSDLSSATRNFLLNLPPHYCFPFYDLEQLSQDHRFNKLATGSFESSSFETSLERLVQIFLQEGSLLVPLLLKLSTTAHTPEHLDNLLGIFTLWSFMMKHLMTVNEVPTATALRKSAAQALGQSHLSTTSDISLKAHNLAQNIASLYHYPTTAGHWEQLARVMDTKLRDPDWQRLNMRVFLECYIYLLVCPNYSLEFRVDLIFNGWQWGFGMANGVRNGYLAESTNFWTKLDPMWVADWFREEKPEPDLLLESLASLEIVPADWEEADLIKKETLLFDAYQKAKNKYLPSSDDTHPEEWQNIIAARRILQKVLRSLR